MFRTVNSAPADASAAIRVVARRVAACRSRSAGPRTARGARARMAENRAAPLRRAVVVDRPLAWRGAVRNRDAARARVNGDADADRRGDRRNGDVPAASLRGRQPQGRAGVTAARACSIGCFSCRGANGRQGPRELRDRGNAAATGARRRTDPRARSERRPADAESKPAANLAKIIAETRAALERGESAAGRSCGSSKRSLE